jgi:hypothetical protein
MNTDAKILNKILANQISKTNPSISRRSYTIQSSRFHPRDEGWFNIHKSLNIIQHINISKDKNHMITSIDAEKTFDKIQHPFRIRALIKLGIEGMYLNIVKARDEKPIANIILKGKN